jgi:hypothetical protein
MNGMTPVDAGMFVEPVSIFLSLALLIVFFLMLVVMATFLFYHGQRYMIQPTHSIRMAIDAFKALKQRRDRLNQKKRRVTGEAEGSSPKADDDDVRLPQGDLKAGDAEVLESIEDVGSRIKEFPIHDAPLWICSFIITTCLYIVFLVADLAGKSFHQDPNWLENAILGVVPIIRFLVPFKSTAAAIFFYLFVEYTFMLFTAHVLYRVLGIRHLNLVGEEDPVRRRVHWLWRTCGFIDYRVLDRSSRLWLIRPVMVLVPFLVVVDMMTYFQRLSVWTGGLALTHLFFIALVRVFDETWLYKVKYVYSPRETHARKPLRQLAENVFKSGALDKVPVFLLEIPGSAAGEGFKDLPEIKLPPLARDFLVGMSGSMDSALWGHQAAGWKKVFDDHESVVLCGPRGSGKRTWVRLVALNEVIDNSGGVLRILPDRKTLNEEVEFMRAAAARSGARWNITVFDASTPEFMAIDIARHLPFLVLADPLSIEQVLLSHWDHFGNFWGTLSRIVVEEIDGLSGLQASHFYYLFRRLIVTRAMDNSRPVALCGTCRRITKRMENGIEHLMGIPMSFVIADTAKHVPVLLYGVPYGREGGNGPAAGTDPQVEGMDSRFRFERPASLAVRIGAEIRRQGYEVYYDTRMVPRHDMEREHVLGSWAPVVKPNPDPVKAEASILFVDHENLFNLADDVRHFGALSDGSGDSGAQKQERVHVCFLFFSHDVPVQYYLLHPEKIFSGQQGRIYGNFVFNPDNACLVRRHLEGALGNMPLSRNQLEVIFDKMTLEQLLQEMEQEGSIFQIEQPDHEFTGCYCLREEKGMSQDMDAETLASPALQVVCPGQGKGHPVLKGESELIRSRFYPGRIFLWNGNRYRVSLIWKNLAGAGMLQVETCEDDFVTSKIRSVEIALEGYPFKGRSSLCTVSGGAPFRFGTCPVEGTETIKGFRILGDDLKPISTILYAELEAGRDMSLKWKSEALLVYFPGSDAEENVLKVVASLWSQIIPAFYGGEFLEADVFLTSPLEVGDGQKQPCLCIREFYPDGGIGVIRGQDAAQILRYLNLARGMLKEMPDIESLLSAQADALRIDADLKGRTVDFINRIIPSGQPASDSMPVSQIEEKGGVPGPAGDPAAQLAAIPESCSSEIRQAVDRMEHYKGRLKKASA